MEPLAPIKAVDTEPAAVTGSVVTAIKAVLATLIVLKIAHLDGIQVASIGIAVEAVLAVPAILYVRSRVTPNKVVAGVVEAAKAVQHAEITQYLANANNAAAVAAAAVGNAAPAAPGQPAA